MAVPAVPAATPLTYHACATADNLARATYVDLRAGAASCAHAHVARTFVGKKFALFYNHEKPRKYYPPEITRYKLVSSSSETTASINNYNSIDSAHKYLVRIYIIKINLSVGVICVNLIVYPLR